MIPIHVSSARLCWPLKLRSPERQFSRYELINLGFVNISSSFTVVKPGDLLWPKAMPGVYPNKTLEEMTFLTLKSSSVNLKLEALTLLTNEGFRTFRHAWSPYMKDALICEHKHLSKELKDWIAKTPNKPAPKFPRYLVPKKEVSIQEETIAEDDCDEDHETELDSYHMLRVPSPGNIIFSRGLPLP
jgi:hypothetical protein